MNETKKTFLTVFIYGAQFVCIILVSAIIVSLFYLGVYLCCTAFSTQETWYSTLMIIASLVIFYVSYWLFENPVIPALWHSAKARLDS